MSAASFTSPWRLETRRFLLPKRGATLEECEDAIGINPEQCRYAVADGATEAFDSRSWARRLAEGWVSREPAPLSVEHFREWVAAEGRALHETWRGRAFPWYAEEKARSGSFAAFVGLQLQLEEGSRVVWHAVALGDACLIQIRDDAICRALPVSESRSFDACPLLVPSHASWHESALSHTLACGGTFEPGDVILLLSDAVAAWYLRLDEERLALRVEFDSLVAASQNEALVELFERERKDGGIKDDDVAVLRLSVART